MRPISGKNTVVSSMAVLEILEFPDPRLRTKAKPVEQVTDNTRRLIDDMFDTMYDARGIDMRQMVFRLFREMLRITNPATGLAGTRSLVVPQVFVQGFDEPDSLAERSAEHGFRNFVEFKFMA